MKGLYIVFRYGGIPGHKSSPMKLYQMKQVYVSIHGGIYNANLNTLGVRMSIIIVFTLCNFPPLPVLPRRI